MKMVMVVVVMIECDACVQDKSVTLLDATAMFVFTFQISQMIKKNKKNMAGTYRAWKILTFFWPSFGLLLLLGASKRRQVATISTTIILVVDIYFFLFCFVSCQEAVMEDGRSCRVCLYVWYREAFMMFATVAIIVRVPLFCLTPSNGCFVS